MLSPPSEPTIEMEVECSSETLVKENVKLSPCLINEALCHEDVWGSGGIAPSCFASALDGGEWAPSPPGLFTSAEMPRYPLERRVSGPQRRSGCSGEEKNLTQAVAIPTELSRLPETLVPLIKLRGDPEDHNMKHHFSIPPFELHVRRNIVYSAIQGTLVLPSCGPCRSASLSASKFSCTHTLV
jgi:hypothetical protein